MLVLVTIVAVLAGCATPAHHKVAAAPSTAARWLTPDDATAEYRSAQAQLVLAPQWSWPQQPIRGVGPDGRPARYERGFGLMSADWYWFCSWGHDLIAQPATGTGFATALGQLAGVKHRYWYQVSLSADERSSVDRELAQAKVHQLAAIASDVRLNCPAAPA
jgi:hypothetical protein